MDWIEDYEKHLQARHLASKTIAEHKKRLVTFYAWLGKRDLRDLTLDDLLDYQKHLARPHSKTGKPNSQGYRNAQLRAVKSYTAFLKERGHLIIDPGENIPVLKTPKTLPKGVLSHAQVMRLIRLCDLGDAYGFRDRTIMEVLFSCGLRGRELCRLTIYDTDFEKRTLRVQQGKGRKDRLVPIGKAALQYLKEYLAQARPEILRKHQTMGQTVLFLSRYGTPLRSETLWRMLQSYRKKTDLNFSTHSFRHACATEMLKGGASIRHVQEMLGHANVTTTEIYTHLAKSDLKKIHQKTAPSERRKNKEAPAFEMTNWRLRKSKKGR